MAPRGLIRYNGGMVKITTEQLAVEMARLAADNKCDDLTVMDLRGLSSVTDCFVIGTGTSNRQIRATADAIIRHGKKLGEQPYGVCGYENATWVLIDFVTVVVHIFTQKQRQYYDLELLWGDAPRLHWVRLASA